MPFRHGYDELQRLRQLPFNLCPVKQWEGERPICADARHELGLVRIRSAAKRNFLPSSASFWAAARYDLNARTEGNCQSINIRTGVQTRPN